MSFNDFFFGKDTIKRKNRLTGEQNQTLDAFSNAGQSAAGTLGRLSQGPQSSYAGMRNWEQEFNQGVVNPAMNQLQTQLGNLAHSNERHSSANQALRANTVADMTDKIASMRYNMLNRERDLKVNAQEQAYQRQNQQLQAMAGMGQGALGTQAYEMVAQHQGGFLDALGGIGSAVGNIGTGISAFMGM